MKTQTALMLALTIIATGCKSESEPADAPASMEVTASFGMGGEKASAIGEAAPPSASEGAAPSAIAPAASASAEPPMKKARKASKAGDSAERGIDSPADEDRVPSRPAAGQLTAGEWSDIENWDFWTSLMGDGYSSHLQTWRFSLDQRMTIKVTGGDGALRNVPVKLIDNQGNAIWTAKTDGQGKAVVFAGKQAVSPFKVEVGNEAPRPINAGETLDMRLNGGPNVSDAIDVMFVVDTTGSMTDELAYIQSEILDVATKVKQRTNNEFTLRTAASVYRDHSDEYLVRSSQFSADVNRAKAFLDKESAGGGGDFPEAVDEALDEAIQEHQWAPNARARLLFLVLDAPPHQDDEGLARLQKTIKTAAAQGIQLIPIVGSGIDKSTEFLMRAMAISTNGTYVFLTDDSGIGGGHIKPTTGDYKVEKLNDLLVRLIVERAS